MFASYCATVVQQHEPHAPHPAPPRRLPDVGFAGSVENRRADALGLVRQLLHDVRGGVGPRHASAGLA